MCHSRNVWTKSNVKSFLQRGDRLFKMIDPHGLIPALDLRRSLGAACDYNVAKLARELQCRECCDCSFPTQYFLLGLGRRCCKTCWEDFYKDDPGLGGVSADCLVPITNDRFFKCGKARKLKQPTGAGLHGAIQEADDGDTIFLDGATIHLNTTLDIDREVYGNKAFRIAGCTEEELENSESPPLRGTLCTVDEGTILLSHGTLRLINLNLVTEARSQGWDNFYSGIYMCVGTVLDIDNCIIGGAPCHAIAMTCDAEEWLAKRSPLNSLRLTNSRVECGFYAITRVPVGIGIGGPSRSYARIAQCSGNTFRECFIDDVLSKFDAPLEANPGTFADAVRESNEVVIDGVATQEKTVTFVESAKGYYFNSKPT